ncbi:MAG: pilin, partial [bacterium]
MNKISSFLLRLGIAMIIGLALLPLSFAIAQTGPWDEFGCCKYVNLQGDTKCFDTSERKCHEEFDSANNTGASNNSFLPNGRAAKPDPSSVCVCIASGSETAGTAIPKTGDSGQAVGSTSSYITFTPQVSIPFSDFQAGKGKAVTSNLFGEYIKSYYTFGLALAGLLAVIMIMYGGIRMVMSGGNASEYAKAKTYIQNSVVGLIILFSMYTILNTVSGRLVDLSFPNLDNIGRVEQGENWYWCDDVPRNGGYKITQEVDKARLKKDIRPDSYVMEIVEEQANPATRDLARENLLCGVPYTIKQVEKNLNAGICFGNVCGAGINETCVIAGELD